VHEVGVGRRVVREARVELVVVGVRRGVVHVEDDCRRRVARPVMQCAGQIVLGPRPDLVDLVGVVAVRVGVGEVHRLPLDLGGAVRMRRPMLCRRGRQAAEHQPESGDQGADEDRDEVAGRRHAPDGVEPE
jgi:hypothetical protein